MSYFADILLAAGAKTATLYCFILSRRLAKFTDLEQGMGGAVAVLSMQVDDLRKTLSQAHAGAKASSKSLYDVTRRAEAASNRLELLLTALHEAPDEEAIPTRRNVVRTRRKTEKAA